MSTQHPPTQEETSLYLRTHLRIPLSHPFRTYAPPSRGEERNSESHPGNWRTSDKGQMTPVGRQSPRPERSHHRATTEKERGRILGKVNIFGQDRTFGVPTFSPHSFDCRLLLRTLLSQPEIQIVESVLAAKLLKITSINVLSITTFYRDFM